MVALNNLSKEAKLLGLERIKKEAEKLVIFAAVQAGINPESIVVETHPSPESYDTDGPNYDPTLIRLAERVQGYRVIQKEIDLL